MGQKLRIDKNSKEKAAVASNQQTSIKTVKENRFHIVEKGETLYSISKQYDMTVSELQKINGLKDNALNVGQELQVKPAN
nr:LysM peptidoglycan-binding domain-containing protein [Mariniflexile fucanivorans]